jgi:hypothetical protein
MILILTIILLPFMSFTEEQDNVYVRSIPIVKILQHNLGYKIFYITSSDELAYIYTPISWFSQAGGKGTIVWGRTSEFPYFSIFWINNEFSHIKLFLKEDLRDPTWGTLEATDSQVRDKFEIEAPEFVD